MGAVPELKVGAWLALGAALVGAACQPQITPSSYVPPCTPVFASPGAQVAAPVGQLGQPFELSVTWDSRMQCPLERRPKIISVSVELSDPDNQPVALSRQSVKLYRWSDFSLRQFSMRVIIGSL